MAHVRHNKVINKVLDSWLWFILSIGGLIIVYMGIHSLVEAYAPEYLSTLEWAKWIAIGLNLLIFIFNEPLVKIITGAQLVTTMSQSPELWRAVIAMSKKAGIQTPRIYIVPSHEVNAFAFGWGLPGLSAVAATRGLINALNKNELESVMAHEIGHVKNKDIMIATVMATMVTFLVVAAELIFYRVIFGKNSSNNIWTTILVFVIFGLFVLLGRLLAPLLQLFVSRKREFGADALAADFKGTGRHLITALQKVHAHANNTRGGAAINYLCFAQAADTKSYGDPDSLFSSHPSLQNRVEALRALEA